MIQIHLLRMPDGQESDTAVADVKKTDSSKLKTTKNDSVYVSPDGGITNEPFPRPGVEYDFCIEIFNMAELPSDAFFVQFTLDDGNGNIQVFNFKQDEGLDAGQQVKAVYHFGTFADDDKDYLLSACIYLPSAPESPLDCAGTFGFNPHMNKPSG